MGQSTPRYDAFLSHSQANHGTVAWLRDVLAGYWVPGRRRRAIFMDRKSMGSGPLRESLCKALRDSRFLIVCCSTQARASQWVDDEVAEFLKTHGDEQVLICRVGEAGDIEWPRSIEALLQRRGELRWPDLRGYPETRSKNEQRPTMEESLSLLADLLGFPGKDDLVDAVLRARARRRRWAAAALATIVIGAAAGWYWLYQTVPGALYRTEQKVLSAAATEIRDTPQLASTAHAFGVLGKRGHVEGLAATVKDHDFRGLVLAAGYAALPEPDCTRARAVLEGLQPVSARQEPRPLLLLETACGDPWRARALPDPLTPDALARWARQLAQTGHIDEARALLARPDFQVHERVPTLAAIAIASGEPLTLEPRELASWEGDESAQGRLYEALQLLEPLDHAGRLSDPGTQLLLDHALAALLELHQGGYGNWNHQQQLAAHLAGAGVAAAGDLLGELPHFALASPSEAPGLAWRALALHRLRRAEESAHTFDLAEAAARTLTPQTRSWDEWYEIAAAAALAGDWRRAFEAAEGPGYEAARFTHRCRVIELWAYHRCPRSSWLQ